MDTMVATVIQHHKCYGWRDGKTDRQTLRTDRRSYTKKSILLVVPVGWNIYGSRLNSSPGTKFGVIEVDCCGCQVVKCEDCPPIPPKEQVCPSGAGARPIDCYTYKPQHSHANVTNCWIPECEENASDAPKDQVSSVYRF